MLVPVFQKFVWLLHWKKGLVRKKNATNVNFFWNQSQDMSSNSFLPKNRPLIGRSELEACCFLPGNYLNSCLDTDLRKNWLWYYFEDASVIFFRSDFTKMVAFLLLKTQSSLDLLDLVYNVMVISCTINAIYSKFS